MISGTLCIPTNKAVQKVDPCGTKYKPLETNSLDYYQFAIEHEEKKVIRVYVDFLKLPTTNESKAGIQTHQVTLNDSEGKVLKDLSASNVVSLLMHILNYENISIERDHKSSTHCQMLLMEFSTKLVFTFPLRSIGPLQWSESHRIKGEERAKNYKKAEKRCEIIKTFLTDENNAKFDKEKEKRIFQMITSMSDEYKYNFTLDEGQDGILVNQDNFTLLKTPEGILEAKYVSILLSGKCYKTILLEEPDRGMHPQFVKRMTQAIKQEVETKGTMVLLTTHNTAFLTPSTLSNCYQFSRVSNACTVIAVRKIVHNKLKRLRLFANDLPTIFFAKRVLFCEGDSDWLFLTEMEMLLLSSEDNNSVYKENKFLANHQKEIQNKLCKLTISKLNGKMNTDECRKICESICLPCRFLLDNDAREEQEKKSKNLKTIKPNKVQSIPHLGHTEMEVEMSSDAQGSITEQNADFKPDVMSLDIASDEQETNEPQNQYDTPSTSDQSSDCFFWSDGTIEDMVNIISEVYDTKNADESTIPTTKKRRLSPNKNRNKLFLNKRTTINDVKHCVETLLKRCNSEDDLGRFITFLLEFD
ncbi:hypothetical protein DPMN_116507 [Dreissena polymorpha]|uniref:ATPase AAA-type core domain-containing protein n=1 Tax=Dreissena polymorpha TaxID=45954 RepID=A0A9D4QTG7_DREPO|nr:hypothetical protein DPMN_116507 [Dreissena polymorpha]